MTNDTALSKPEFRKTVDIVRRLAGHIENSAGGRVSRLDVAGSFLVVGMQLMIEQGDLERLKAYVGTLMLELAAYKPPAAPPPAGRAA